MTQPCLSRDKASLSFTDLPTADPPTADRPAATCGASSEYQRGAGMGTVPVPDT
jgi:hypothetical protein